MAPPGLKLRLRFSRWLSYCFGLVDMFFKKSPFVWVFPVYFVGPGIFADNMLAVFESVKDDPQLTKVVLTRGVEVFSGGVNVRYYPMRSWMAVVWLLRAGVILVQHSVWNDLRSARFQPRNLGSRLVVNLWHGVPIKDISHPNSGIATESGLREMPFYRIVTSSACDRKHMRRAFPRTPNENFWITGVPRNDFLLMPENRLPISLVSELTSLRRLLQGRKLILYAPTYRETNVGGRYYDFSDRELDAIDMYLRKRGMVLGLRYHEYRQPKGYEDYFCRRSIVDLSGDVISDVRILVREASAVISDYSSIVLDAVYAETPILLFLYDLDHYLKEERGFLIDIEELFTSNISRTFPELVQAIKNLEAGSGVLPEEKFKVVLATFFAFRDSGNTDRVVRQIRFSAPTGSVLADAALKSLDDRDEKGCHRGNEPASLSSLLPRGERPAIHEEFFSTLKKRRRT